MHTYIPDLAPYPITRVNEPYQENLLAIGWLNASYPYPTGVVPQDFVRHIELFCSEPLICTFGAAFCSLCGNEEIVKVRLSSGKEFIIYGENEIRILSLGKDKIYAAPDLLLHYVKEHHYRPPQEFIDAVLAAPLPGNTEYDLFRSQWKKYHY
jgi:hypothetical protein